MLRLLSVRRQIRKTSLERVSLRHQWYVYLSFLIGQGIFIIWILYTLKCNSENLKHNFKVNLVK